MNTAEPKIFGIGLSKTATTSLDRALNDLGIRSVHFPCDPMTYKELSHGIYELSILKRFRAVTDISVSPFYAQLDKTYPNSKFILTVRNLDAWLESIREHFDSMWQWAAHDRRFHKFAEFITACVYGAHHYQRDRFIYVYHQHLNSVREYFANRPRDLLTLDICGGDGWEPLCAFLNAPIPAHLFPYANRHHEKTDCAAWIDMLEKAVGEFQAAIPANARYILIDDERFAGSRLEDPSRSQRLLEREGLYWGPPADTAGAIAEIERLRSIGSNYLVFTWPAFWWLEYYADLEPFLMDRFRTVLRNERLLVMEMCP